MKVTLSDPPEYPECLLSDHPRSPGLHLTTILRDMAETAGIGKQQSGFSQDDLESFAALGWMWEDAFDTVHRNRIIKGEMAHPGEFESPEGIFCTPDYIDWNTPKVIELKVRWRSASTFDALESNYWIELMQIASYCYLTGIQEADLVVFFVAGNWRPPVPIVRMANLQFGEQELEEKWRSVVRHARWRGWLP